VTAADFKELLVSYRFDGLSREQQPWLATVWRAAGSGAAAVPVSHCSPRMIAVTRSNRRAWVDRRHRPGCDFDSVSRT
jgi:hypothetical protein